jgi:hypothetical protein
MNGVAVLKELPQTKIVIKKVRGDRNVITALTDDIFILECNGIICFGLPTPT